MSDLYLINDHDNSFDTIINSLINVLHQHPFQANQCALLAHYKGETHIKSGDFLELLEIQNELSNNNILTKII